jgi:hypothetical protein
VFYDRFRTQLGRYAAGVHELGAPAGDAALGRVEARLGRALPPGLRDFYRSWNGARLFHETIVIAPVEELFADEDGLRIGEALGAPLAVDARGRVVEIDDLGERVVAGSTVERWLEATMAREGLLVDREGEFKDVFAGEGALTAEVRRKRVRLGEKADPGAASFFVEAAELSFDDGDDAAAEAQLARAVELDPGAAAAWELLASLVRRSGRAADAERAYVAAARATRDAARRAERWAEAARAANEAGREARAHAAESLAASPERAAAWLAEARRLADEGDVDGALNRATLAQAVRPDDAAPLVQQLRARRALRVL